MAECGTARRYRVLGFPTMRQRSMDPFALLGLVPNFDHDPRTLRAAWLRQVARVHPDAEGTIDTASRANEAFRLLSDPSERAQSLLRHLGWIDVLDDEAARRALPDGFLLEMIEYRERADALDPSDRSAHAALLAEAHGQRDASLARISGSFKRLPFAAESSPASREEALAIMRELNVLRSFDRMIEQLEREHREPAS